MNIKEPLKMQVLRVYGKSNIDRIKQIFSDKIKYCILLGHIGYSIGKVVIHSLDLDTSLVRSICSISYTLLGNIDEREKYASDW